MLFSFNLNIPSIGRSSLNGRHETIEHYRNNRTLYAVKDTIVNYFNEYKPFYLLKINANFVVFCNYTLYL